MQNTFFSYTSVCVTNDQNKRLCQTGQASVALLPLTHYSNVLMPPFPYWNIWQLFSQWFSFTDKENSASCMAVSHNILS